MMDGHAVDDDPRVDSEIGLDGIVEWPELQPLLPSRGVRRGATGEVTSDGLLDKISRAYNRNMSTEQGKRTTLGFALLMIAVLLSGSIIVLVTVIKSNPDSKIYGAMDVFNERIRHPHEGDIDMANDGGTESVGRATNSPSLAGTRAPTLTTIVDPTEPIVTPSPKPDPQPAGPEPGSEPGPDGQAPRPTFSPTVYDPLAPTRKPSPDPNATKKPTGKVVDAAEDGTSTDVTVEEAESDSTSSESIADNSSGSSSSGSDTETRPSSEDHESVENNQEETDVVEAPVVVALTGTPETSVESTVETSKPSNPRPTPSPSPVAVGMDMSPAQDLSASGEALSVLHVSNEYGLYDRSRVAPYPFLDNSFLLEPYKETLIWISGTIQSCTYDYTITAAQQKKEKATRHSGTVEMDGSFAITLTDVGQYKMTLTEHCGSNTFGSSSHMFFVKYVRRELSTLNDVDREEFLDAFHTLWTVSTVEGQKLYGDKYKSIYWLATLHNDGGGNAACDEFHGDVGFLNNHMYLSAYLEQSLQLVNPKVALHYMEYSKYFESSDFSVHLGNQLSGGGWTELFTSKFFGRNNPISGQIMDGRWTKSPVPRVTPEFLVEQGIPADKTFFPDDEHLWQRSSPAFHVTSPYGLLRSPWNYNPANYTVRYDNVFRIDDSALISEPDVTFKYHMGVRCLDYQIFFDKVRGKPLKSYLTAVEDDTHGIVHFTFGGVGGDKVYQTVHKLINTYGFTYSNIAALAISAQPFFKLYMAQNPAVYSASGKVYPLNCTASPWDVDQQTLRTPSLPGEEGGPQCDFSAYYYQSESAVNELVQTFFKVDPSTADPVRTRLFNLPWETRAEVMKLIANMFPYDGDLAGSGAALDPLFWVAHGAVERLYQKSVFAKIFSDMTYERTYDFPCSGHDKDATKAWLEGFSFVDKTVIAETLTNEQLNMILDPTSDEYRDLINFVYDTNGFEWCEGSDQWFDMGY